MHGQVWLAESKAGEKVAIKMTTGSKGMTFTRNEIDVLRKLSHPNIIPVLDSEEDGERLFLVMPYIENGDLLSYLRVHSQLREDLARSIFSQLLSVLEYIHNRGYVHRDIKLENILFDPEQKKVFLIDWGFAGPWSPGKLQVRRIEHTFLR